ncbi:uncharacterized protein LOC143341386 [Colletes latitarsis]|uniref:uncharacterized protein LOC143341386 n=1 Tax=Colletes latitarsis TaxID=2605962 RepID=UPI004036016A
MVSRFREKQYQLAAQKQNEAFRKYDYYQQTAKYFERACRVAKQYDSWNYNSLDPKGEFEKAKKTEKLLTRRNKLRNLLKEEEETYRRELEERKRLTRPQETSLEQLREKLKQKRAEQSLYYPKTCRRFQSYFVCPTDSSSPRWSTLRGTNLQYSTNSNRRSYKMSEHEHSSKEQGERDAHQETTQSPSSQYIDDFALPNPKFSARYARKSLENTNVRTDDFDDYVPDNRPPSRSSTGSPGIRYASLNHEVPIYENSKENGKGDPHLNSHQEVRAAGLQSGGSKHIVIPRRGSIGQRNGRDEYLEKSAPEWSQKNSEVPQTEESAADCVQREKDEVDRHNAMVECQNAKDTKKKDNRQFEVEKSMPWLRMDPGDKNLSKQMFMYLTHSELKAKIEDLAKREQHACNKHCWDEALRLRDMRNRVELIREKQLYNIENLDLDEEVKKLGLHNIGKREAELAERESICTDTTMYSQDAKDMWQKWVHEDDRSAIKDAREQRETFMDSLEKEWQDLAIRDKERITRTYQNVIQDSNLQEEHKLTAALNAAKIKSFPSSLK